MVVVGSVLMLGGACLVPPSAPLQPPNHAPEIDLSEVIPSSPILRVSEDCEGFDVQGRLLDRDDDALRYRLIANNRIENKVRGIKEFELLAGTRAGRPFIESINPARHLRGLNPHTLSLIVTDAPTWAVELHDETTTDRGLVDTQANDAGAARYAVVEYRWLINIVPESGSCP